MPPRPRLAGNPRGNATIPPYSYKTLISHAMTDLADFVHSLKLPVMPEAAQALVRTLNDDNADITVVRDIIATDPALTTTLLRIANSAMFGLPRTVSTLDTAVSVIGMAQIRARALAICLANVFTLPPQINRIAFWQDCMKCAGYSRWLAIACGLDEIEAWLSGMVLRLGRILVIQAKPQAVEAIEAQPCAPGERWERERAASGFDEGQVMAEVARRWDLPYPMVQALDTCARAPQSDTFSKLAGIVQLAALLAEYPHVAVETLAELPEDIVHRLGLNLLWMGIHLPDPQAFTDTSFLQN